MSLNELHEENAKLLKELKAEHIYYENAKTENEKMRKVIKRMHDLIKSSCNVCDGCCCSSWDEENECCVFDSYMCEFKIW